MRKILIDLPEIIETPRIKLQMPCAGFGEKLHSAMQDGFADYVKWLNWQEHLPSAKIIEEECRKHHAEFILRDSIRYLIIDKVTQDVVGRCAFPPFQVSWDVPQFGISYFIRKSYRSKGYASEATHAMALIAFKVLGARKLEIHCDAENIASNKIPLKLGFKMEYVRKGGYPRQDGGLSLLQTYSIFSESDLPSLQVVW